jgi:hypothetical protein
LRALTATSAARGAFDASTARYGARGALGKAGKLSADELPAGSPVDMGEMVIVGRPPRQAPESALPKIILVTIGAGALAFLFLSGD